MVSFIYLLFSSDLDKIGAPVGFGSGFMLHRIYGTRRYSCIQSSDTIKARTPMIEFEGATTPLCVLQME